MAISQNFPDLTPSLNLNFAGSKKLDSRVTFTRGSTGTYMDDNGIIKTAGINQPRFDHSYNGTSVESLGLLIEESRTNILNQSVVTTSNWTGGTGDTTYSDLSLNALGIFPGVEVTTTTGFAWHRRTTGYNVPFVSGTQYAVTFYYREGTSGYARLQFRYNSQESLVQGPADGSNWYIQQNIGSISNVTTTLMDGQSTYKTTYTFTPNFTGNADMGIGVGLDSAGTSIVALGAQVEAGSFSTSYIPTSGSSVTRSADNASITGTNFSSWYNTLEGTTVVECENVGTKAGNYQVPIAYRSNIASSSTTIEVFQQNGTFYYLVRLTSPSDDQVGISVNMTSFINSYLKYSFAYKANDFGYVINNTLYTDTSGSIPSGIIGAAIGSNGAARLNGHIRNISYCPKRLTNTELQNLTK